MSEVKPYDGSRIVVCSSGFLDPLHEGHLEYLERSKALGDVHVVIVNNDHQAMLKKGTPFMPAAERLKIVRRLRCVDFAILAVDTDRSVCETLKAIRPHIFTNGGDQTNEGVPEAVVCNALGIRMVDGLGAKIQSSSKLIEHAKAIGNYKLQQK